MGPFNLIVTHNPGYHMRLAAERDLERLVPGLRVVWARQNVIYALAPDARGAVEALRSGLTPRTPILRVIPVDEVVRPRVDDVRRAVHRLLEHAPGGSVAVRIEGRLHGPGGPVHRRDAAVAIMEGVERPVDLDSPDVLILVKVSRFRGRRVAAVYVGPSRGVLSVVKEIAGGST